MSIYSASAPVTIALGIILLQRRTHLLPDLIVVTEGFQASQAPHEIFCRLIVMQPVTFSPVKLGVRGIL